MENKKKDEKRYAFQLYIYNERTTKMDFEKDKKKYEMTYFTHYLSLG
jgi:hypothetical protein